MFSVCDHINENIDDLNLYFRGKIWIFFFWFFNIVILKLMSNVQLRGERDREMEKGDVVKIISRQFE